MREFGKQRSEVHRRYDAIAHARNRFARRSPLPPAVALTRVVAVGSLLGLIALGLAWELWLAPLHPGGSWLVLKVLPLCLPLAGLLRNRMYTYRWVSLLVWIYFTEGVVRAYSDRGLSARLALRGDRPVPGAVRRLRAARAHAPSKHPDIRMNELIGKLRAIVGDSHVLTDGDLSAWEQDWRKRARGKALAVVRPGLHRAGRGRSCRPAPRPGRASCRRAATPAWWWARCPMTPAARWC